MPKMKTKSSAKKRFRVRPGGTVKSGHAFKRHILTKKTTKNKENRNANMKLTEKIVNVFSEKFNRKRIVMVNIYHKSS